MVTLVALGRPGAGVLDAFDAAARHGPSKYQLSDQAGWQHDMMDALKAYQFVQGR